MSHCLRYERRDDELMARVVAMKRQRNIAQSSFRVDPSPDAVATMERRVSGSRGVR